MIDLPLRPMHEQAAADAEAARSRRPRWVRSASLLCVTTALAACVTTPRLYSEQELGSLAQRCGYALGEVVQDEEEKKLLLVLTAVATTKAEENCIYRWARKRRLHVVFAQVEGAQPR